MSTENSENPILSVIITAYNQEYCITKAIDSVLLQDFKDFEVIVVDDCSTDDTPVILNNYKEQNSQVKIVTLKENSSSHVARLVGVENATGKYSIFLDGDDYLEKNCLSELFKELTQVTNFDACEFSYICLPSKEIVNPDDKTKYANQIDYFLNKNARVTVWNKLYKTEVLKKAFLSMKKTYIRCGDDTYESICIAYFVKNYVHKNIVVTNYVTGNGVSFHKNSFITNEQKCKSLKESYSSLKDFFEENPYENSLELLQNIQKQFLDWIVSVMKNNTEEKDIIRSLIILPRYFPENLLEPYFYHLYKNELKKKHAKNFIKKMFGGNK